MNRIKLIGIAGPARAGKDTAADRIIEQREFVKTSFADPIKEMLMIGLGLTAEQLYGKEKEIIDKRYNKTPRYMMQTLGTEWGRDLINKDIWINCTDTILKNSNKNVIIPDVRFESEAEYIRKNGILIHVKRKLISQQSHKSESGVYIDTEDYIFENNSTLSTYYGIIDRFITNVL